MRVLIKAGAILLMFAIGNRVYNHETAWGGIAIMGIAAILAVYAIIQPINNNKNEKD